MQLSLESLCFKVHSAYDLFYHFIAGWIDGLGYLYLLGYLCFKLPGFCESQDEFVWIQSFRIIIGEQAPEKETENLLKLICLLVPRSVSWRIFTVPGHDAQTINP